MLSLPLQLTPFEEYFLRTDLVDSPSSFLVRIEFTKELSRVAVEKALAETCLHNLLSNCVVEETATGKPSWVNCPDELSVAWLECPIEDGIYPKRDIDITRDLPIRILGYDGKGSRGNAVFALVVHHVAFDGLGFLQWLSDWIDCYRSLEQFGNLDELKRTELNQDLLLIRCRPKLTFSQRLKLLPGQWKSIRAAYQIMKRKAIPLVGGQRVDAKQAVQQPCFKVLKFSAEETLTLKKYANSLSASTNSLVARDILVVIKQWQAENSFAAEGTHFRLMVPVNERGQEHRKMPACNHCTMVNLDRTPSEIENELSLLASITQEMGVIRKYRLSLNFWRALSVYRWLPGGLERQLSPEKVSSTALFTNLGYVLPKYSETKSSKHQSLAIEEFTLLAPLNRGMVASLCMYYLRNELRLALQYDDQSMTRELAESFMDMLQIKLLANQH